MKALDTNEMRRKTRKTRKGILVYADTSVYGGVFDKEFDKASRRFFDAVRDGQFRIVVSAVIQDEIAKAPARVRALFDEMAQHAQFAHMTDIAETLQFATQAASEAAGLLSGKNRARKRGTRRPPRRPGHNGGLRDDHQLELQTHCEFPKNPAVQ